MRSCTEYMRDSSPGVHSASTCSMSTDPVYYWWKDLLVLTDSECMTYLQSKPIDASSEAAATAATGRVGTADGGAASHEDDVEELSSLHQVKERMDSLLQSSQNILEEILNITR